MAVVDLSHEQALVEEARIVGTRIRLYEVLGSALVGITDPYKSDGDLLEFYTRLQAEAPDVANKLHKLNGRMMSVVIDRSIAAHIED